MMLTKTQFVQKFGHLTMVPVFSDGPSRALNSGEVYDVLVNSFHELRQSMPTAEYTEQDVAIALKNSYWVCHDVRVYV